MKISKEWLEKKSACIEGIEWFNSQEETDAITLIKKLNKCNHFDWANWLIARILGRKQKIRYTINAAELVLYLYEDKYPNDNRPRKAIEAAKGCLEDIGTAAGAAHTAAYAAHAAYAANYAAGAAHAAYAAAYAAYTAAYADDAAYAAAYAITNVTYAANAVDAARAARAARAAAYVADAARAARAAAYADDAVDAIVDKDSIKNKIINFGIELIIKEGT